MADLTKDEAREKLYIRAAERMFNLVPNNGSSPKKVVDDVLAAPPEVLAEAVPEEARRGLLLALAAAMGGHYMPEKGSHRGLIVLPDEVDGEGER